MVLADLLVVVAGFGALWSSDPSQVWWRPFTRFDGQHYIEIATRGYCYSPEAPSTVAFFPLYPLLVQGAAAATGMSIPVAALVTSNLLRMVYLVELFRYARVRAVEWERVRPASVAAWTVVLAAISPLSFFLRMAYSESTFLTIFVVWLSLLHRRRSWYLIALVCGLATAARPVGVALVPISVWYIWQSKGLAITPRVVGSVACLWGLACYMGYLQAEFGAPWAFATTQQHWSLRPHFGTVDKVISLASLEPLWATYMPGSLFYWRSLADTSPVLSLQFSNPIVFVATAALVAAGMWRGWLTAAEGLTAVLLMGIPYVTRAYEMNFNSQGRFSLVVVPATLVAGRILFAMPKSVSAGLLVLSGILMTGYAYQFARGYPCF